MPSKSPKPPFDGVGFFTQFLFGALAGAILGAAALAKSPFAGSTSYTPLICFVSGGALLFGFAAGLLGDEFWRSL